MTLVSGIIKRKVPPRLSVKRLTGGPTMNELKSQGESKSLPFFYIPGPKGGGERDGQGQPW